MSINPKEMAKAALAFIAVIFMRYVTPALLSIIYFALSVGFASAAYKAYDHSTIIALVFGTLALHFFTRGWQN